MKCLACGSDDSARTIETREMMFGWRDAASYVECATCGTLQIAEIPHDLARFYPADYYSLVVPKTKHRPVPALRRAWAGWMLRSRSGIAERIARAIYRKTPFFAWARIANCSLESAILDVGSGSGGLLRRMRRHGFSNLTGVDPFSAVEIEEPGYRILRSELSAVSGRFDLIMFHYVLEHVRDPNESLAAARALLAPGGTILARIPVAGSHACREYGEHWYNLDPPRHIVVPSIRGMEGIARRTELRIVHLEYDCAEQSYLLSESYRRGIPGTQAPAPDKRERARCRQLADRANRTNDGDLAAVYLRV